MKYKQYWKSEFERALRSFSSSGYIVGFEEISDELQNDEIPINEFVYRINLRNKSASIIVFSSVDKRTEKTRSVGADAVRIIYEWKTKNGMIYSKICKRNRVEALFTNVQESITESSEKCMNLSQFSWGTLEEALA